MWDWLFGKKSQTQLDSKDPSDFTLTSNSTEWRYERHCSECKSRTGHNEYMADVCNSCGAIGAFLHKPRTFRKIYHKGVWVYQYRYGSRTTVLSNNRL